MSEIDALRDRLAELTGWTKHKRPILPPGAIWQTFGADWTRDEPGGVSLGLCHSHPFPTGDLTALAAAWPEGWSMTMHKTKEGYYCEAYGRGLISGYAIPEEYEARLRLTVAVLEAGKGGG